MLCRNFQLFSPAFICQDIFPSNQEDQPASFQQIVSATEELAAYRPEREIPLPEPIRKDSE